MAVTQHRSPSAAEDESNWQDQRLELLRLRSELAALRFLTKGMILSAAWRKANFDHNQPRNPAGMGEVSGRWVDADGSAAFREPADSGGDENSRTPNPRLFIAIWPSNSAPFEEPPPPIPPEPPASPWQAIRLARVAAQWVARAAIANPVTTALVAAGLVAGFWLHETYGGYISSYLEAPKTLDQLQADVRQPRQGTDVHHIVEQGPAEAEGFSRNLIDGPDNLVRISTFKHWEINGYYNRYDEQLGASPRNYLRGKSWEDRTEFGLKILKQVKVLSK
ncbi:hypothetical protein [Azorhizobium doebereinerae]|uniref:hypothetical protein n=1 Tax=Azorhizobium doebereinerae TaxID=281091 RepID=UPI00041C4DF7|nr:hypothetical protein [Azorhizobium doebereinerae]